jgi:hypothetical protein
VAGTRLRADDAFEIDDEACGRVCTVLNRAWVHLYKLSDPAYRYRCAPTMPDDPLYLPGASSYNAIIAHRMPRASIGPQLVDGWIGLVLDYTADEEPLGAMFAGPWIRPEARGRRLAYDLHRAGYEVAERHLQAVVRRNVRVTSGTWWEHYYWTRVADGQTRLPDGWRYVPGPSDALIDREALVADCGTDWPAEHLDDDQLEAFGYAVFEE